MDRWMLFKVNGAVLSPRVSKRKAVNEIRASKRSELYTSSRNISLSPQPQPVPECKENFKPPMGVAPVSLKPANVPSPKLSEKQLHQKAFLLRYLAWKAEKAKQNEEKLQKVKRAPFVVPTRCTASKAATESTKAIVKKTFAPRNHVFNPPVNITDLTVEITGQNSVLCVNGNQKASFEFVPTPKKKSKDQSKFSASKPVATYKPTMPVVPKAPSGLQKPTVPATLMPTKPVVTNTPSELQKPTVPATLKPMKPVVTKTPSSVQKPTAPVTLKQAKPAVPKVPLALQKQTVPATLKGTPAAPPQGQSTMKAILKPKMPLSCNKRTPTVPLKEQPKEVIKPNMAPPSQKMQKISRRGPMQVPINNKLKKDLPPLKRPTFKATRKGNPSISNAALPILRINGKTLLNELELIPDTPTDNVLNPYTKFVTSIKRKSSSGNTADLIFAELGSEISPVDNTSKAPHKAVEGKSQKFDFIRYEVVQDSAVKQKPEEQTSEKIAVAEPPPTYLSPYVSVARGKVSTRVEKEKRNSVYMAADDKSSTEITPEVRHTLATVCYYRKQLADEIARLNERCVLWEEYKHANAELMQDSGVDIINVTIGQTKLLTTKKLKQFAGLIDRCEDRVKGKTSTGEGESAKIILPEDLEGFWSVIGLQIENVDKRFDQLERWKANNWSDPDPTDNVLNPYTKFVTSIKRKSSSGNTADLIFAELGSEISPVDNTSKAPHKAVEGKSQKFDFIRYEVVQDSAVKQKPEEQTSEKIAVAEPPPTYLSPYVSVARGKVSTRVEKEKRNSVYMAADDKSSTEITPEVRHTLATVCYYRKQLADEIARLNERCVLWEEYKHANAELMQDSGVDIINVTIGQTKLLTTKKLKQFAGLIDRCEDRVKGKTSTGEGESAKIILPEDLEGFWSVIGLQIENVDKRFAQLERWKANNWSDPDDVPAAKTAVVKKAKKRKPTATSTGPNSALQKMLRTAHAAYLNKKTVAGTDEDVILTPSKSRQVLIRDRRFNSPAPTIIKVNNTPRSNRKLSPHEVNSPANPNETPKLLSYVGTFRKSMNLLKNALLNEQERKLPISPTRTQETPRKSILKTPGCKSRPKSVIFNSPTLMFTIEHAVDDDTPRTVAADDNQEAVNERAYKLRNRTVILRDSAEFVLPK